MKKITIVAMLTLFGLSFVGIPTAIGGECGTGSPGYWVNHPDAWPQDFITIDGLTIDKDTAIAYMKGPNRGDKSLTLFRAFAAAQLNVANGCEPPTFEVCEAAGLLSECTWDESIKQCVYDPIPQANLWFLEFGVGTNIRARTQAWQASHGEDIYDCLDAYNNGLLPGFPSRD